MAEISKPQAVVDARAALIEALSNHGITGLPDSSVNMMLGQAMGESMFGRNIAGYHKDMAGSNNWGSVQATPTWEKAHQGQAGWGKFAHRDTHADKKAYVGWFRLYPDQLEGANGYVSTILYDRNGLNTALQDGTADAFAQYLKSHGYYEADESVYAKMLGGMQSSIANWLSQGQGLTAADPAQSADMTDMQPLAVRVGQDLVSQVTGDGIVWFGAPPAGYSSGGGGGNALTAPLVAAGGSAVLLWSRYTALPSWQQALIGVGAAVFAAGIAYGVMVVVSDD